jgi:hypothetical protein
MKKLKKLIFGKDVHTTIAGYILAVVIAIQPLVTMEDISDKVLWRVGTLALLVAVLGRMSSHPSSTTTNKTE